VAFLIIKMMMASRGGGVKLASSMMLVSRSFSTAISRGIIAKEAVTAKAVGFHGDVVRKNIGEFWVRGSVFGVRHGSTMSFGEKDQQKVEMKQTQPVAEGGDKEEKKGIASYWGVPPSRVTKEDGAEWKWNCFRVRLLISLNIFVVFILIKIYGFFPFFFFLCMVFGFLNQSCFLGKNVFFFVYLETFCSC
jgi:hypothetical protein